MHITGRLTAQQLQGGSRAAAPSLDPLSSLGPRQQRQRRLLRGEDSESGPTAAFDASSSLPVADGLVASEGEHGPYFFLPAAFREALEGWTWLHYAAVPVVLWALKDCVLLVFCGPKISISRRR